METPIRVAFFGTHDFAAAILDGLLQSPLFEVALVITQPDRPVGRKQELQSSTVKKLAELHGRTIHDPAALKTYNLTPNTYDLGIVAEYGILIPQRIISSFPHGMVNVHTSLLPKYRGASPIQTALLNGESETGVTIMMIDAGLDTGDILLQKKYTILPDDTYKTVSEHLAPLGIAGLVEAIPAFIEGTLQPQPQDNTQATTCRELTRDDGQIDWQRSASDIYNQYRGLTPWPGIWTTWEGKRLKILDCRPQATTLTSGQVQARDGHLLIGCAEGTLLIHSLQLEGKQAMSASVFLNGYQSFTHATLI